MRYLFVIAVLLTLGASTAHPQAGRAAVGAAARSASRSAGAELRALLRRDLARDRTTVVTRLAAPRTVFRYTTRGRAAGELRRGIAPGAHLTSRAGPGRPPSVAAAQARYGLPAPPGARELVHLPRGTPVRFNRALGGRPGTGEISLASRILKGGIRRVVRLR